MTGTTLTPAQWKALYAGLELAARRYRLSPAAKAMATASAKDCPVAAWRCYSSIMRSLNQMPRDHAWVMIGGGGGGGSGRNSEPVGEQNGTG